MMDSRDRQISAKIALMDPFPAMGHVRAFLQVAEWLKGVGFTPVFVVSVEFVALIEQQGYRAYVVTPFLLIPDSNEIKEKGSVEVFLDSVSGSRHRRQEAELRKRLAVFQKIVAEVSPSRVFLDDHYSPKALMYQSLGLQTTLVSTMTLPIYQRNLPPFQDTYIPSWSVWNGLRIGAAWCYIFLKRWQSRIANRITCLGSDHLRIFSQVFATRETAFEMRRCFGIGVNGLPIIATYPKNFGFRGIEPPDHCYFLGRLSQIGQKSEPLSDRLFAVMSRAREHGQAVVYCSLGTVTYDELPVCQRFFGRILQVAASLPRVFFIVNVGKNLDVSLLPVPQPNVAIFDSLPQQSLLPRVQLMINHGGINSIKECIVAEVPMIVYPLSLKWDQPGCGARVVHLNLGKRGNIRRDGVERIRKNITEVLAKRDSYLIRIRQFKSEMEVVNGLEESRIRKLLLATNRNQSVQTQINSHEAVEN